MKASFMENTFLMRIIPYVLQARLLGYVEILVFLCMASVWEKSLQWAVLSALAVNLAICWKVHQREVAWPMGPGLAPNLSVMVSITYMCISCVLFFSFCVDWWKAMMDPIYAAGTHCSQSVGRRLWFQGDKKIILGLFLILSPSQRFWKGRSSNLHIFCTWTKPAYPVAVTMGTWGTEIIALGCPVLTALKPEPCTHIQYLVLSQACSQWVFYSTKPLISDSVYNFHRQNLFQVM